MSRNLITDLFSRKSFVRKKGSSHKVVSLNATEQDASDEVQKQLDLSEQFKNASDRWMEKSLFVRTTPIWAKSLITLLFSLGSIAVLGEFLFVLMKL